jgi:hypothetical protein
MRNEETLLSEGADASVGEGGHDDSCRGGMTLAVVVDMVIFRVCSWRGPRRRVSPGLWSGAELEFRTALGAEALVAGIGEDLHGRAVSQELDQPQLVLQRCLF